MNKISLEQSLKAYQVHHAPSKFSWKQHWAQEKFSSYDMLSCTEDEKEQLVKMIGGEDVIEYDVKMKKALEVLKNN